MNENSISKRKLVYGKVSYTDKEIISLREEDFEVPHGMDYKLAIEELEKIQNSPFNDKLVYQLFQYRDIPIWWFIYQSLISRYKKEINFLDKLLRIVKHNQINSIEIHDDFTKFNLIKNVSILKKIPLNYSKFSYNTFQIKNQTKDILKKKHYEKVFDNKYSTRKELYFKKYQKIPDFKDKILFAIPTAYRRKITDPLTGRSKSGEYIQESILKTFDKNDIVCIDLDYTFHGDLNILSERMDEEIRWVPLEVLVDARKSIQHDKFLRDYNRIIDSEHFQKLFKYKGISLWQTLENFFVEMSYKPYIPFYLNLIDSLFNSFHNNKPRAIFLPYETGPVALAIISIFKKLGIKTIGIQHGYIYQYNPMYSFGNFINEKDQSSFPLPDSMFVFGNYVKRLLASSKYPENRLIVLGNPAFFNLEKLKRNINEKTLLQKHHIPIERKILLFATGKLQRNYSSHGKYDYDEQIFEYLLKHFASNKEFFIILKPHPSEKNTSVYEQIISNYKVDNVKIINDDLFELIMCSSLVVSVFSSAMIDSLFFEKPVIRVKFDREIHPIFDKTDAIVTSSLHSLFDNIHKILDSEKEYNIFIQKGRVLLKDHYGIPEENPDLILKTILEN